MLYVPWQQFCSSLSQLLTWYHVQLWLPCGCFMLWVHLWQIRVQGNLPGLLDCALTLQTTLSTTHPLSNSTLHFITISCTHVCRNSWRCLASYGWAPRLLLDLCEVTPASPCVKNILSYLFLFVHPYVVLITSNIHTLEIWGKMTGNVQVTHPSPKNASTSMVMCTYIAHWSSVMDCTSWCTFLKLEIWGKMIGEAQVTPVWVLLLVGIDLANCR